jgi:hypothetical protein
MKRFGQQSPRFTFFLNPYTDARFTRCPKCDGKTKLRKLPLFIHVFPSQPIALNKTCRYCPVCDLLIAHKDELDALLNGMFAQPTPDQPMADYLVVGTIDRADWQEGSRIQSLDEIRAIVHDFKKVQQFEPMRYMWIKE